MEILLTILVLTTYIRRALMDLSSSASIQDFTSSAMEIKQDPNAIASGRIDGALNPRPSTLKD